MMLPLLKSEQPHKTYSTKDAGGPINQLELHGYGSGHRGGDESSQFRRTKTNRYSSQTEATEAPTLSTLSPIESPERSEQLGGLAPRPSSFINHSTDYEHEFSQKRNERQIRNRENIQEEIPRSSSTRALISEVTRDTPPKYTPFHNHSKSSPNQSSVQSNVTSFSNATTEKNRIISGHEQTNYQGVNVKSSEGLPRINGSSTLSPYLAHWQQPLRVDIPTRNESAAENEALNYRSPLQKLEMRLGSISNDEEYALHPEVEVNNRSVENMACESIRTERPSIAHLPSESRISRANDLEPLRTHAKVSTTRTNQIDPKRDIVKTLSPTVTEFTPKTSNEKVLHNKDENSDQQFNGNSGPKSSNSDFYSPKKLSLRVGNPNAIGFSRDAAIESHPQLNKEKKLPDPPSRSPTQHNAIISSPSDNQNKPERRLSKLSRIAREKFLSKTKGSLKRNKNIQVEDVSKDDLDYLQLNEVNVTSPQSKSYGGTEDHHYLTKFLHKHKNMEVHEPYTPARRLNEWRKSGVAQLSGACLELGNNGLKTDMFNERASSDSENLNRLRHINAQRKAEAFDGEYDETAVPSRFKPHLFLQSGPMLRYCGLRREVPRNRTDAIHHEREIWRGSVMIVCKDLHSSYELAPTLRLFLQPMELLPPPPSLVDEVGLAPEYVDPLAGLPRIGRDGRTLYVRPVEELDTERDLSREESADGLFEMNRPQLDELTDSRAMHTKSNFDGEKAGKYKEVRGFRLHSEQGMTFWRFNIEIELKEKQQRIAYRINRGPATGFWVPPRAQAMNIMYYSGNGFSPKVDPNTLCGPDPMWRDVLNTHQTEPFHVMLGGGNQIYNDNVLTECRSLRQWSEIPDLNKRTNHPFTAELEQELNNFYLNHYCSWFSQGLFGLAVSQIPMVNVIDSHEILDGFGSYQEHFMRSRVIEGLGAVAFKYYMLFQHQSCIDDKEETEPSWILGARPGPYIKELSRSIFTRLGRSVALLGLDCRTERTSEMIISAGTYHKIFSRLENEIAYGDTKHLIVVLGVPRAHVRLDHVENFSQPNSIQSTKTLGRKRSLTTNSQSKVDNIYELLDNVEDYKTARIHQDERRWLIQELQELAAIKSVRITILGGGINIGAVGLFYSNPKYCIPKECDFRYMANIIPSSIANAPPPEILSDLLKKKKKIRHLDSETEEGLMPIFTHDVNGKPRSNKRLLSRRNWCSIRVYDPTLDHPSSNLNDGFSFIPLQRSGSLLRRLSSTRGRRYSSAMTSPDSGNILIRTKPEISRPPLSNQQFFNDGDGNENGNGKHIPGSTPVSRRGSVSSENPSLLQRARSLTLKDFNPGNLFRRRSSRKRSSISEMKSRDETEIEDFLRQRAAPGNSYESEDNEIYFSPSDQNYASNTFMPASTSSIPVRDSNGISDVENPVRNGKTELYEPLLKKGSYSNDINLEDALNICLHFEVNSKDPAGITTPYRLLVPALFYEKSYHAIVEKN